jgi:hypothetical protein
MIICCYIALERRMAPRGSYGCTCNDRKYLHRDSAVIMPYDTIVDAPLLSFGDHICRQLE